MRQKLNGTRTAALAAFAAALMLSGVPAIAHGSMYNSGAQQNQSDQWNNNRSNDQDWSGSRNHRPTYSQATAANFIAMSDVNRPKHTLADAKVEDQRGHAIGRVQRVKLDRNGRVEKVEVAVDNANRLLTLFPANMYYDRDDNAVVTRHSKSQIMSLLHNVSMRSYEYGEVSSGSAYSSRADDSARQAGNRMNNWATSNNGVRLSQLDYPTADLDNATVQDAAGRSVGQVRSVETNERGKAQRVNVSLNAGNRIVAIPAADLRYDRADNTLKSTLDRAQIVSMPY